jgi:hypothetical protein
MILARTENRDGLEFFTLALTRNLDRVEARDSDGFAAKATDPVLPETPGGPRQLPPAKGKTSPGSPKLRQVVQGTRGDARR